MLEGKRLKKDSRGWGGQYPKDRKDTSRMKRTFYRREKLPSIKPIEHLGRPREYWVNPGELGRH